MIYEAIVDGAARGQGKSPDGLGHGAAAVLIYKNKKLIGEYTRGLGRTDNSHAEYEAILMAIVICCAVKLDDPVIYSDSLTAVNQINRVWECKSPSLYSLLYSVWDIRKEFRFRVKHVPKKLVAEADACANQFLDELLNEMQPAVL